MKSFRDRNPYIVGIISVLLLGGATGFAFLVGTLNLLE
ncbi:MAG TPA: MCE family protein, partial [Acidimicrobiaceae bacterium]|nr:MCE family protein [Acidimicrobiaceae bacterium]